MADETIFESLEYAAVKMAVGMAKADKIPKDSIMEDWARVIYDHAPKHLAPMLKYHILQSFERQRKKQAEEGTDGRPQRQTAVEPVL